MGNLVLTAAWGKPIYCKGKTRPVCLSEIWLAVSWLLDALETNNEKQKASNILQVDRVLACQINGCGAQAPLVPAPDLVSPVTSWPLYPLNGNA